MKESKRRILLVDDDLQQLREIRRHLEKLGYEVATASEGIAALRLTKSGSPDLIILNIDFLDFRMAPERRIDGIEVLHTLGKSGEVWCLVLSATSIAAVEVMALAIGANECLAIPLVLEDLTARIAAILRRGESGCGSNRVSFRIA